MKLYLTYQFSRNQPGAIPPIQIQDDRLTQLETNVMQLEKLI
ncbi:MAG: hypothetical protein OCD76_19480 [Reichenbachiella sp.]